MYKPVGAFDCQLALNADVVWYPKDEDEPDPEPEPFYPSPEPVHSSREVQNPLDQVMPLQRDTGAWALIAAMFGKSMHSRDLHRV